MRSSTILAMSACFWLASYGAGLAQPVENGLEVRVNPGAASSSNVLLYPGGEFSRAVPQLLYPGQKNGPIALHLPTKRRVSVARAPDVAATPEAAAPVPEAAPAPKPKPKKVAKAEPAAPAPAQSTEQYDNSGYTSFASPNNFANVFGGGAPAPAKPAPKPAAPKPAPAAPTQVAKASPPPPPASAAENAGLTKRSVILFAKDAPDPAKGALGSIKFLAGDLNAAMNGPTARVELQAFGGTPGDKGSDARRLSLKRALAIRQILIDDGVSPDRIDVRAMGGSDDSGPADRVDVFVRA
ncbi:MAG TPA: OmpA family protein [Rhizomicrobium sp.]|jgi:outer membrane protein OmpA-like peptidoglycan-associated protein